MVIPLIRRGSLLWTPKVNLDELKDGTAEKELKDLQSLVSSIRSGFTVRILLLKKKHEILASIGHDFYAVSRNPKFYPQLRLCLKREKKLVDTLMKEYKNCDSHIHYAINLLGHYEWQHGYKNIKLSDDCIISARDFRNASEAMIVFLRQLLQDFSKIESRIEQEENFLKHKDPESFYKFLEAWDEELELNEVLMNKFNVALRKSQYMFRNSNFLSAHIYPIILTSTRTISLATGSYPTFFESFLLFMIALVSVAAECHRRGGLVEVYESRQLIKKVRAMNIGRWH